ncbi:MAG: hypothetical protein HY040_09195 [Planctomycetes bacterium]|nr:hypothetical protein [Planctomycetota bacterium]
MPVRRSTTSAEKARHEANATSLQSGDKAGDYRMLSGLEPGAAFRLELPADDPV